MVDTVREKLPALDDLCRRHGVDRLWLVGSATGRGRIAFDSESDVDFVVDIDRIATPLRGFSDPFWRLWADLEQLFRPRPIQLIELHARTSPSFRASLDTTRELIYDARRTKAAG